MMDDKKLVEVSRDNLSRILGFFPRVDTLLSVILAINLGLVAVLASNAPAAKDLDNGVFIAILFLLVSTASFYHLYKCAFPKLDGGHLSLLYFREIANKTEMKYKEEFRQMTEEFYLDDLMEQTWRNSKILSEKFDHIRWAFIFMLLSLVPWLPAFLIFASRNTDKFLSK